MSDPISNVLERLDGVKGSGNQFTAPCPAHNDRIASLCIGVGDDGKVLMTCQAGCETISGPAPTPHESCVAPEKSSSEAPEDRQRPSEACPDPGQGISAHTYGNEAIVA